MTETELLDLAGDGREIINDLFKIIPSWRDVDTTKAGYNDQYVQTLINVALYVVEREKALLEVMKP